MRSRVAESEAGYFLPFVVFCFIVLFAVFCIPALSPFSVRFLKSDG